VGYKLPYVTFNGVKYHYSASMPGNDRVPRQAVVFVHGSGGSHQGWQKQLAGLGKDFLTMAVDLPGHGLSGGKPCDSIEAYREFMFSFAERIFGFPFFLAGHSMGGAVALDFALNYPELLAGVILIGTGSRLKVLPAFLETLGEGTLPAGFESSLYREGTPEVYLKAARADLERAGAAVLYADLTACNNFDISGRLGEIKTPALVITGEKDVMTPVKYGRYLRDNLIKASLEVVEDAGHMPMQEQADRVNALIGDFMIKNWNREAKLCQGKEK
jgi:pimeloyl-ACP methyl ester carboxylesterase